MSADSRSVLKRLITERRTFDRDGVEVEVTGAISLSEADYLHDIILSNELVTCLETGVAYGASTVAICAALAELERRGRAVKHYGVDPCQIDVYKGAAIAALEECGSDHLFELYEQPSHLALPKLVERNLIFDFVFVDGMHTFDYTLLDLFFSDKLLRPGGILCIHDMDLPSKKKALRYLLGHRKYVRLPSTRAGFLDRIRSAVGCAVKGDLRSSWRRLITSETMAVVRKTANFEPPWDFYARI